MSAHTVERWLQSGRLIRVHRGVYAVGYVRRNPIEAAHAALLAGGERSALAGASALVLWGIWRRWPRPLEIVVAGDRRPSRLIVHHSMTLTRGDIAVEQGLRVTSPARTLLDTAPRLTAKQLARAVNDLRLRDLLTLDQLRDICARNPTNRGATLLRPHLELAQDEPTRSVLEDVFLPLLRRHGLPVPEINVLVGDHRVDAYFPDQRLVVELDGWSTHGRTKHAFTSDRRQDAEILLSTGIPTVRIPHDDVNDDSIERLVALLEQRAPAWRPPTPGP